MFLLNSVWLKTWRRFFCKLYTVENSTVKIQFPLKKKTIKKKIKITSYSSFWSIKHIFMNCRCESNFEMGTKNFHRWKKKPWCLFNAKNVVLHKKRGSKILHCFLNMYGSAMVSFFWWKMCKTSQLAVCHWNRLHPIRNAYCHAIRHSMCVHALYICLDRWFGVSER